MKVRRSDSRSLIVIFYFTITIDKSKRDLPKVDVNENGFTPLDDGIWMSKSTTVNKNGFKPFADCVCQSLLTTVNKNGFTFFANGGCQSLLQSTRMGLHTLLMVDVKVYYSSQEWVYILC